MKLLTAFRAWRKRRRLQSHVAWLRKARVVTYGPTRYDTPDDYRSWSDNYMKSLRKL
jgi:hypothetical protein